MTNEKKIEARVLVLVPNSSQAENVPRDLVYGCWCAGKRIGGIKFPPLSNVLVATVLQKSGINADFRDLAGEGLPMETLDEIIGRYKALVMLTSTMTINEDANCLNRLKEKNPALFTIVWGSHPTFLPRQTLSKPGIDVAVRREGEYIIRDLLSSFFRNKNWRDVKGIAYSDGEHTVVNEDYPFIQDLDELPFPDRGMLSGNADYFNPAVKRMPYTTMYTTRGCPGRCIFCTAPPFYGGKVRMRSAENIIRELIEVADQGYKEVFFRDEIFTTSKKRIREVIEGIQKHNLDLTWICSARIGTVDDNLMGLMKSAGCHMIRVGVESGIQDILDRAKKGIRLEQTREFFRQAKKHRMETHAHMMIGMPGETKQTARQTIDFVKKLEPTIVTFGICTPYPGTELFEQVRSLHPDIADGSSCNISKLHRQGFFNSSFCALSENELGEIVKDAYRKFYGRPSYLFRRLAAIRSMGDLNREIQAGLKIFSFAFQKEKKNG